MASVLPVGHVAVEAKEAMHGCLGQTAVTLCYWRPKQAVGVQAEPGGLAESHMVLDGLAEAHALTNTSSSAWAAIHQNCIGGGQQLVAHDLRTRALTKHGITQVWPLRGTKLHSVGKRTLVMAILNVTPDSFSDGGTHTDLCALHGACTPPRGPSSLRDTLSALLSARTHRACRVCPDTLASL